jgi:hypothetical protein
MTALSVFTGECPTTGARIDNRMNLQCRHRRANLTQPRRYILPAGNWRDFLILICGLLLLAPAGYKLQRQETRPQDVATSLASSSLLGRELLRYDLPLSVRASVYSIPCNRLGWTPTGFGLKDHSIFIFNGFYYLASIRVPNGKAFVYARSTDLCHWEDLGPVIDQRIPGEWDDHDVWAPFVLEDNGVFYMYYTGVRSDFTQSIMLATSSNPADPASWQRQGLILQPDHAGMQWQAGSWADCRDASVLKIENIYYMVYTGLDITGPIIGWATALDPAGPWQDQGATLALSTSAEMAESPMIVAQAGTYYLIYNNSYTAEEYRIGESQIGPWSEALPLPPGWANEMWVGQDGLNYTSFLQSYEITILPYLFDDFYHPPRLFVGASSYRAFLPYTQSP